MTQEVLTTIQEQLRGAGLSFERIEQEGGGYPSAFSRERGLYHRARNGWALERSVRHGYGGT